MTSFKRKFVRIRAMKPTEVFFRLIDALRDRREFNLLKKGGLPETPQAFRERLAAAGCDLTTLLPAFKQRRFFLQKRIGAERLRELHQQLFPHSFVLGAAEQIVGGRFFLFDRSITFDGKVDWAFDARRRRSVEAQYWKKIDLFSGDGPEEVRYVWELNRHHAFVLLAQAWFLTGNNRFSRKLFDYWRDWIESNPYLIGVNWCSALECAMRLISWSFALQFVKSCPLLDEDLLLAILKSVDEHLRFIEHHRSRGSSANNHLLGEALGLIVGGCFFPELPKAEARRRKGFSLFFKEFTAQVYEDGVAKEQSLCYQAYLFEFGLLAKAAAEACGTEVPPDLLKRLQTMADFIDALADGETLPAIGDDDGGTALPFYEPSEKTPLRILPLAEAAFELQRRRPMNEAAFWLMPLVDLEPSPSAEPPEIRLFPEGGYLIWNRRFGDLPVKLILDGGPLGLGPLAAHGHADALALWMSIAGKPLLIDCGTFLYLGAEEERTFFRSSKAHSTLCLDGRDSAEALGPFQWGRRFEATLERLEGAAPAFRAVRRADGGCRLERRAEATESGFLISDSAEGVGNHRLDAYFHLAPGTIRADDHRAVYEHPDCRVEFAFSASTTLQLEVTTAVHSPRFGVRGSHPVLKISAVSLLPIRLTTAIEIHEKK